MKVPFDSDESKEVNQKIFESIYYGSLEASMEIARDREEGMRKLKIGAHQLDNDPNYVSDEFITSEELYQLRNELKPLEIELERDEYLGTYSSFIGSPLYHGKLQFDLWNEE